MSSLYRTYRPRTFADVVGQQHVVETLKQAISQDKISHAYLFQGPRGTGKTTLARLLAMRVNCAKPKGVEACGKCASCQSVLSGSSLDIIEIDAASNRGIDDIRALRETIATAPTGGHKKVYIVDEVHMLTNEAFAALLKTLEEPAPHAIFVLATTELHKVPETILSRCQVFRFRRASAEELEQRLTHILKAEKQKLPFAILTFVISRSDGCFRDAESLLGQILTISSKNPSIEKTLELLGIPNPQRIEQFLQLLESRDVAGALTNVQEAYEQGYDPELFVEESIRTAREKALDRAKAGQSTGQLPAIIRALIQAKQDLAYVPQPLIALELAILSLAPAAASAAPPKTSTNAPAAMSGVVVQEKKTVVSAKVLSQPVEAPTKPAAKSTSGLSLEHIQSAWPQIIQRVKTQNPAASTFLRAMEAEEIADDVVTIRAQFGLHRNFFEKDANRQVLVSALTDELKTKLSIRIRLDEQEAITTPSNRRAKESELLQNVKEIFGS